MPAIGISPASSSQPAPQPSHVSPLADGDSDFDSDDENNQEPHAHASTSSDEEVLGLPSDFNPDERKTYDIELLADYETQLRIGQVFDLLEKICEAVKHLSAFIEEKKEAHAVADHVRSNDVTKYSVAYCQKLARQYNLNFDRLVTLRGQLSTLGRSHPASRLQRIDLANDLKVANLKKAREQGDHTRSGSWIWSVFEDVMDCLLMSPLVNRAQWFRAWQEKCRYDEAVNILCAEFRATSLGFSAMGDLWKTAGERQDLAPGERAYAWQHHGMFERLSQDARAAYHVARKSGVPAEQLDHTRVSTHSLTIVKHFSNNAL
ncbi:hypothetical protein LXA43DRAFT_905170 [Ganoderma leucocontextum]|nr:hypothetical protein LXA43DRAFT_905170 [Ganoderma leucocontextum]